MERESKPKADQSIWEALADKKPPSAVQVRREQISQVFSMVLTLCLVVVVVASTIRFVMWVFGG